MGKPFLKETAIEGKTYAEATITIQNDTNYSDLGADGSTLSGTADLYIMFCDNPWPAIDYSDSSWFPWRDAANNCTTAVGDCSVSTNYEIYYCRHFSLL